MHEIYIATPKMVVRYGKRLHGRQWYQNNTTGSTYQKNNGEILVKCFWLDTLPETNIVRLENGWLGDYLPFGMPFLSGAVLCVRECTLW